MSGLIVCPRCKRLVPPVWLPAYLRGQALPSPRRHDVRPGGPPCFPKPKGAACPDCGCPKRDHVADPTPAWCGCGDHDTAGSWTVEAAS